MPISQQNIDCQTDCPHLDKNQNCFYPGGDGEVVQCVGEWAKEKYYYLERYLSASKGARKKFSKYGNAVYIDLFAGPGKCRIRWTKEEISGGVLRVKGIDVPFNRMILNDISYDNIKALKKRIDDTEIHNEDANKIISSIVDELLKTNYKYHFAYLDPSAPKHLNFQILKNLSMLDHVDLLINFPIESILRNYDKWLNGEGNILDNFLGTIKWRNEVKGMPKKRFLNITFAIYLEQIRSVGFPPEGLGFIDEEGNYQYSFFPSVKNSNSVKLYYLILASKHKLGTKLWNSIQKYGPTGEQKLF
jgi:three-Cys-motif partner protein